MPRFPLLVALLLGCSADGPTPGPAGGGPKGDTPWDGPVVMENEFAVYQDAVPFVKTVKWDHPKIVAAMRAMGPGWRSTFSYSEWKRPYGLESEDGGGDTEKRNARVRNFIRVLVGEFRDNPGLLEGKLDTIISNQVYAGPGELAAVDLDEDLFKQITYPAYRRLMNVMQTMHAYRQGLVRHENDGFNYNFGDRDHASNRVETSVPPWTHCEMKFIFSRWLIAGAPAIVSWATEDTATQVRPATYQAAYEAYEATDCTEDDLGWMYNFRGHKNFMPLWFESNAFVWSSRRGGKAQQFRGDPRYYQHPFADRYLRSRAAWAAYLFYPEEDHVSFRQASESGGGPILYLTDQDLDENGVADYRLFADHPGCGDNGLGGSNPSQNCNMVPWETAAAAPNSRGAVAGWEASFVNRPDMGFGELFPTFEQRMARFNQALDRHTNWGPTGYYMIDASSATAAPNQIKYIGAYSPIVACSYDISASNNFASGDYPTTDPFESGRTKWMYVMKLRTEDYYDEKAMREGRELNFDRDYYNETSLSNDYYVERALDRFGWVPEGDLHANIYFVYGARGEEPPPLEDIPPP